jgi:ATP-dependent DNA ligase
MLAYKNGARVRLISRNAVDHTARFRELAAAIAKLCADVLVLDGEVAVFDKDLVSRFHLLGDNDDSGFSARRAASSDSTCGRRRITRPFGVVISRVLRR